MTRELTMTDVDHPRLPDRIPSRTQLVASPSGAHRADGSVQR